jgi:hypothetical protein
VYYTTLCDKEKAPKTEGTIIPLAAKNKTTKNSPKNCKKASVRLRRVLATVVGNSVVWSVDVLRSYFRLDGVDFINILRLILPDVAVLITSIFCIFQIRWCRLYQHTKVDPPRRGCSP